MFIAMNRFRVTPGSEADFEKVWTSRDSHLSGVPGFMAFHLLRGPAHDDHVLGGWRRVGHRLAPSAQVPVNRGLRFSMNAAWPSL